jgi:hypothetical protein
MTVSTARTDGPRSATNALRLLAPVAVAALAAFASPNASVAQSGAPLRLAPPPRPAAPAEPAPSVQTPATRGDTVTEGGIVVQRLGGGDGGAVGVLSLDDGGLAGTVWQGSSRGLIADLLARAPGSVASPPLHDLLRRLLLTAAPLPPAATGGVDADTVLAARARLLVAMGAAADADALVAAAGRRALTGDLAWPAFEARLLAGDIAGACSTVRARAGDLAAAEWQKALIFCQLVAEQFDQAQFGLSLLRERRVDSDTLFLAVAEALAARQTPKVDATARGSVTPLNLALLRLAWTAVPEGFLDGASASVAAALARSRDLPEASRLAMAMQAEAFGALPVAELRSLVVGLKVTKQELAAALTIADTEAPARAVALLYRAAQAQDVPAARVEVLSRLWEVAAANGMAGTASRLATPLLADVPLLAEFGWFAGAAARMALFDRDLARALGWYDIAAAAASTDSVADGVATGLWPLLRLALGDVRRVPGPAAPPAAAQATPPVTVVAGGAAPGVTQPGGVTVTQIVPLQGDIAVRWDAARLERWLAADAGQHRDAAAARAQRMLALLDAAGDPVPDTVWRAGLPASATAAAPVVATEAAWRLGLDRAGAEGRQGETVLFAVAALGGRDVAAVDAATLHAVVRALAGCDYGEAARAFALDAALVAGL